MIRIFTLIIDDQIKDDKPTRFIEYRANEISLIELAQILPLLISGEAKKQTENKEDGG